MTANEPVLRRVEIDVNAAGRGSVKVDGVDLSKGVQRIEVELRAGQLTEVRLTICGRALRLAADAAVEQVVRQPDQDGG